MSAKSKVEQANALHAEAVAKKKQSHEWWEEAHKAAEDFYAAAKTLAAATDPQATLDALAAFKAAHAKLERYSTANAPHEHTAGGNWWAAKNDAVAALAAEAGLIMKLDRE